MWVPAAYILLLLACSEDGGTCVRVAVPGFVSKAACMEGAQALAPAIREAAPALVQARAACLRGKEERDA